MYEIIVRKIYVFEIEQFIETIDRIYIKKI